MTTRAQLAVEHARLVTEAVSDGHCAIAECSCDVALHYRRLEFRAMRRQQHAEYRAKRAAATRAPSCTRCGTRGNGEEHPDHAGLCMGCFEATSPEADKVIRYVVTHVGRDRLRVLTRAAQGRYTYATAAEAQEWIRQCLRNNSQAQLAGIYGPQAVSTFAVCRCPCWAGHHDPVAIYFDEDQIVWCEP